VLRAGFMILMLSALTLEKAQATSQPANLFDAVFGPGATPQINKVVVMRVNPWIGRVISPTVASFYRNPWQGDSQAVLTDRAGIDGLVQALRDTAGVSEGCNGTTFTAQVFPYSWVVIYHDDESNVLGKGTDVILGSIFISLNGLCASTGKRVYFIGPDGIGLYLKRTFSFMNF
jgi:hypothetical protein